jgi:hypothetical protein
MRRTLSVTSKRETHCSLPYSVPQHSPERVTSNDTIDNRQRRVVNVERANERDINFLHERKLDY